MSGQRRGRSDGSPAREHSTARAPTLSDGTPIPSAVCRRVLKLDGTVLEDITHKNE
jgi:hypothetical protein